ncbi:hypothetical protein PGT21_019564 [Puccinia graminis f. sp. tritici]|uniref:Uncharacterized protein n=1 Tax=Puccinia graminis f. sp. tritici TaxID=56615 RepID=A0A5B0QXS7_PUCGR|nr:hypothetical protein PGT21_019564 [Puccinia graminis f. sp. tritici]
MGLGAHGLPTPRWVSVSHCHAPQSQTFKKADQGNPHAAMPASNISDSALQTPTSLAKNNTQAKKKKLFDGQTRDLPQARPDPNCLKSGAGLGILFGIVARPGPPHAPRRGGFGFWPRARPIDSLILNELVRALGKEADFPSRYKTIYQLAVDVSVAWAIFLASWHTLCPLAESLHLFGKENTNTASASRYRLKQLFQELGEEKICWTARSDALEIGVATHKRRATRSTRTRSEAVWTPKIKAEHRLST